MKENTFYVEENTLYIRDLDQTEHILYHREHIYIRENTSISERTRSTTEHILWLNTCTSTASMVQII